jgi:hypothetical protein
MLRADPEATVLASLAVQPAGPLRDDSGHPPIGALDWPCKQKGNVPGI